MINENDVVAVEELEGDVFGDNDTLSAMVANLVDADLLVLLGEVNGLHTADPHGDPSAQLIPVVERFDESLEFSAGPSWDNKGRGGMITKIEAARLATTSAPSIRPRRVTAYAGRLPATGRKPRHMLHLQLHPVRLSSRYG